MMEHSFLFGHLVSIGKIMSQYPRDTSGMMAPLFIAEKYPELAAAGVVYMDTWPFAQPCIAVIHPDIAAQFTQERSLPKADFLGPEWEAFTQNNDLLTLEGQEWRAWRSVFNPGFSSKNITALLPGFLEEIQVFKDRLIKAAESREIIRLEEVARKGTIDIICRAVLLVHQWRASCDRLIHMVANSTALLYRGIRLHSLTSDEPFSAALRNQASWLIYDNSPRNLVKLFNPLRPLAIWNNNRIMRNFLTPHIKRGLSEYNNGAISGPQTVNYLAVKSYASEIEGKDVATVPADSRFISMAISHLKMFIFAGHETTASTLSFVYSLLYSHPSALARMRDEHDRVLGPDRAMALGRLSADPALLNQMPYTSAVVKETLRLYPPVGTARQGQPGFFLRHPDEPEQRYPTDGFFLFGCSFAQHRLDDFWERGSEFLPERWLAQKGDPLYVWRKGVFRPFEMGPRNCIGQELVQVEIRAILAMTVRDIDIELAYPENAPTVLGEKAYQTFDIAGHVKDGFPIRIRTRGQSRG